MCEKNVATHTDDMNQRDKILLEIMQNEMETQRAHLRTIDSSLHTLAFAYIASLSLCVPALLTVNKTAAQIEESFPIIGTVLCTIVFIGGFYALMLIRSRNVHLAHVAFLSDRINSIITKNFGLDKAVLFQQTSKISAFYFGDAKGRVWFAMYGAFFALLAMFCFKIIYESYAQGLYTGWIVLGEAAIMTFMYAIVLKNGGIRAVRKRIDKDYGNWLINQGVGQSSGRMGDDG